MEPLSSRGTDSSDRLSVLTAAFEEAADMILVTDDTVPPVGWPKILFANREVVRETGYERDELIGRSIALFFAGDADAASTARFSADIAAQEITTNQFLAVRKDGSTFAMEMRGRPVFDADGRYRNRVLVGRNLSFEHERKKTEAQLGTLRALIDEAADFIFVTDSTPASEGGPYFTYANKALLKAGGYTLDEVVGRSPGMFFGPDTDPTAVRDLAEHLQRGESHSGAFRVYRKDGTSFWTEFNGRVMVDPESPNSTRWIAVGRDITDRHRIEQELNVLRTAIESADDSVAVYEVDPVTNKPRIMFMNDALIRHSGFSREELTEKSTGIGPETDQAQLNELRRRLQAGDSSRMRLRLYRKDGSSYWGEITAQPIKDDRGRVTHIVSIERDVTDAIAREQELESDNRVLASLMEVSRRMFGALNSDSLRAHLLSGIERLTNIKPVQHAGLVATADPFLQRAEQSRVPIVDRAHDRAAFAIPASSTSPAAIIEIDAAGAGIRLDRGAILALQLLVQNYRTALQNAALYEEIEERRSAVVELNQTKSDLIAMLAHDFRGPLTSIMGFADLMRTELLERDEEVQMLNLIVSSADSLTRLANDTLSMSRMEENELTLEIGPLDFVALARDVAAGFSEQRSVNVTSTEPEIHARADGARLRQALENLIGNAVKYSPEGGDVDVEISRRADGIEVCIRDAGIGIAAEDLGRIFHRFARGVNAQRSGIAGTGFGLYISQQIVERHGGSIRAESTLGEGSTFIVDLPLVPGALAAPLRVLLGDRDGSIRSLTTHTLRSGGYAVRTCGTWNELDREIATSAYDLAIIDAESFGDQAFSVQAFLDACNAARIPVIVIGADRADRFEGVAATLAKPYLAADLLESVARLDPRKADVPAMRPSVVQGH